VRFVETPPKIEVALAAPLRPRGGAENPLGAGDRPDLGFADMAVIPTGLPALDFRIDPLRHEEAPQHLEIAFDSVRLSGMALSVGMVWWAARAGGLLASLMASTPAWRHVDPLPVLGRDEDEPEIDWTDPKDKAPPEEEEAGKLFDDRRTQSSAG
jgi:hypothetical protein